MTDLCDATSGNTQWKYDLFVCNYLNNSNLLSLEFVIKNSF